MRFLAGAFLLFLALFGSCKRKSGSAPERQTGKSDSAAGAPARPVIRPDRLDWPSPYWTAKARVSVNMGGSNVPVTLTLRASRDESLWFSANAMGLLEVGRGLVQGDSLLIWDKMNNRCYVARNKGMGGGLPITVGLRSLQNMLMGGIFWDSLSLAESRQNGDTTYLQGNQGDAEIFASVLRKTRLLGMDVSIPDNGQTIRTVNGEFKDVQGFPVAFRKEITSTLEKDGKKTQSNLSLQFSRFDFVPEKPEMKLEVPADCERKSLQEP